jgi:hypothetical protein
VRVIIKTECQVSTAVVRLGAKMRLLSTQYQAGKRQEQFLTGGRCIRDKLGSFLSRGHRNGLIEVKYVARDKLLN